MDFRNLLGVVGVEEWKERLKESQLSMFEILAKVGWFCCFFFCFFSPPLQNSYQLSLVLELLVFKSLTLQISMYALYFLSVYRPQAKHGHMCA